MAQSLIAAIGLMASMACAFADDLPAPQLTPGVADPALSAEVICAPGFRTGQARSVSGATKAHIYAAYGMSPRAWPCPCEIDHLVSLELGGANDPENLWPQSYVAQPWNAHGKDRLENRLHREVCSGALALEDAQRGIAADWIAMFIARFGRPQAPPQPRRRRHRRDAGQPALSRARANSPAR